METHIHTTFDSNERARAAVQALLDAGFPTQDVTLAQAKRGVCEERPLRHRTRAFQHSAVGAALGAVPGIALALVAPELSTDVTLLEAFAAMLSDSPALAALQGAFLGSIGGGLVGLASGIGVWKQEPAIDDDADAVLVGVHTKQGHAERAVAELKRLGARRVERTQRGGSAKVLTCLGGQTRAG